MQVRTSLAGWGPQVEAEGMEVLPGDSFGYFTEFDTCEPPWRGCPAGLFSCGITSDAKIKECLSLGDREIEDEMRSILSFQIR